MKKLIVSAVFPIVGLLAVGQTVQRGIVREYNEERAKTPLSGVEVRVYPAQSTVSDREGKFSLEFLTLNPGERISVRRIEKDGYEVFNKDALEQWNLSPDNTFSIVMCRSDRFKDLKDLYFEQSQERYARQYRQASDNLRRLREANRIQQQEFADSLRKIENLYSRQLENLDNYVDRFARIDLSELSEAEREIIALVREGQIDEAIARYDQFDASGQLIGAIKLRNRVKNAITQLLEVNSDLDYSIDSLYAMVDRQIQTLQLTGDYRNNAKIQNLYTTIADADTTNVRWLLKASEFLWKTKANYPLAEHYVYIALNHLLRLNDPDPSLLGGCYNLLGVVTISRGDYDRAEEFYNKALEEMISVLGAEHPDVAITYNNLASLYPFKIDYDKAKEYLNKAIRVLLRVFGEDHPYVATSYNNLGAIYSSIGDYTEAEEFYKKALEIRLCVLDSNHHDVASSYENLGTLYAQYGNIADGEELCSKALEMMLRLLGTEHPDVGMSYDELGGIYAYQGNLVKAEEYFRNALVIKESIYGPKDPRVATSFCCIGSIYASQGNLQKAEESYNNALDILIHASRPEYPNPALLYIILGKLNANLGNYDKAIDNFKKVLDYYNIDSHNNFAIEADMALAMLYYASAQYTEAKSYMKHAIYYLENMPDSTPDFFDGQIYTSYFQTLLACLKNDPSVAEEIDAFMADKLWCGTIAENDAMTSWVSPGNYYVLELGDWNFKHNSDLNGALLSLELQGRPKSMSIVQGDKVGIYNFGNQLGITFSVCKVSPREKARVEEAYTRWKEHQ